MTTDTSPPIANASPGAVGDQHHLPSRTSNLRRMALVFVALLVLVSGVLLAVVHLLPPASGTSASREAPSQSPKTVSATANANANANSNPTILYQADWSRGADGWSLPAGWHAGGASSRLTAAVCRSPSRMS